MADHLEAQALDVLRVVDPGVERAHGNRGQGQEDQEAGQPDHGQADALSRFWWGRGTLIHDLVEQVDVLAVERDPEVGARLAFP